MKDFYAASTPEPISDDTYRWEVPDTWQQGRGAYGGLVLAAMVRAFEASHDEADQPLRTLTAGLTAPVVVGPADIHIEMLRRGNNTASLSGRLIQAGELRAHATALFGRRRVDDGDWCELETPVEGDWREAEEATLPTPPAPVFTQHLEYRPLTGVPFSGAESREIAGWVRPLEPGGKPDAALLTGMTDAYWPAPVVTFTRPRPIATVSFTMEFLGDFDGLDEGAPVYYRGNSPAARDGYTAEFRELWGADGRLLALNQQTICMIK